MAGALIPPIGALLAGITAVISIVLYIATKDRGTKWGAFVSYILMAVTSAYLVTSSGHVLSPLVTTWMILTAFAGVFGLLGIGLMSLAITAYLVYLVTSGATNTMPSGIFIFVVPLVISGLIWRKNSAADEHTDKAYSALARELSQVANKSEIVINAIADGVVAVDHSGVIQLLNPAAQRIMGWGKEDALELDYRSVFKLTTKEDKPLDDANDPIQLVLRTNTAINRNDLNLTTNAGKKMIISLAVSPVGQGGSGAIIVFRDITGDVAENRQKAEFISTASHEMRTPVAAIEGYLGLALNPQTATIDDKARLYLTKAHESAQHLGQLFQDLLDVSKAEDGRLSNNPTVIDVTAFLRDIITGLMPGAVGKQQSLIFAPDRPHGASLAVNPVYYVNADQSHYREVIANLIENAIKYTKTGGEITVDVAGDNDHVVVSVVDNGIGIPKEDISHLFQKFYRVDNSDTREIGGTGLGLYLCRRLVEAMDGRIWVESDYGKGSMFFVELPRITPTEAQTAATPSLPPVAPPAA